MKTKNDEYNGPFTEAEADQARAYLRENGGAIQEMMNDRDDGKTEDGRQLFLINDTRPDGEDIVFVTALDELIVSYYRRLMSEPLPIGDDGGTILPPDGSHRFEQR